ncbi:carboxymuconolactone decarboxylase family protein [Sphingomonas naphthae]|uniref:Carboxymuconolactone decarboxylase family protein n=1 Tax=Sphingomonas naphthae TaxID=1813468 RepID=A0ABY7TJT2_9SPHN|nr:carboxymuconolactone decarboxylase family protein [Sphingomonas naphthae]WCT73487.1 carboxymuconolactone decarboxylase family protein [Sphingomonas naphthae]
MADQDAARIEAREARIMGHPPRIAPMTPDEFTDEARESVRALRRAVGLADDATAPVPEYVATTLRHPALYTAHTTLALHLMRGALADRDRELAILRTGWLCQAPFEFGEHVKIGRRTANLTPVEVEWVTIGSAAPGWGDHDRAIIRAVEELHADAMISDETWAVLARRLDDRQLLELPILVGQYMGVAFQQNSLRVRMMPGNVGLMAR